MELQLFKADTNCSSSLPTLSSNAILPTTLNFHETYPESNTNSLPVSIKMEIDIDSEISADASNTNLLPSIDETSVKSEKLPTENNSDTVPDGLISNESSSTTGSDIENNRTTKFISVVTNNTATSNNTGGCVKPPLKNNTVLNGVNSTKFIKCTDPSGRILLVPQSSLVCLKSQKLNSITAVPSIINNVSEKNNVINVKKPLPSYILKVLPVCSPKVEKKTLCVGNSVALEVNNTLKLNNVDGGKNHLTTVDSVTPKIPSWELEISNIK